MYVGWNGNLQTVRFHPDSEESRIPLVASAPHLSWLRLAILFAPSPSRISSSWTSDALGHLGFLPKRGIADPRVPVPLSM